MCALRKLRLSLADIAVALARSTDDLTALRDVLVTQLAELDARAQRLVHIRRHAQVLLEQLNSSAGPDPHQLRPR